MIKKIVALPILCAILVAAFGLMLWASLTDSGTMDELAHIPSGYSYMKYRDYRLNPEHPPLVKDLAGLPLTFMDLNFPTDHQAYTQDINGQWWMGSLFLYESGNNPDVIIRWARLGPMLITLALILLTYIWGAEILGPIWALFPAGFLAFSPIVLAHGHYVTTDVGAAFGIMLGIFLFVRYVKNPTRKNLWIAGVGFGIAQLMKFSAVLLIPHFVFLAFILFLVEFWQKWRTEPARLALVVKTGLRWLGRLLGIFAIGFALVALVYAWHMPGYPTEKQRSDTEFILSSFAQGIDPTGEACDPFSGVSLSRHVRCFANLTIWASDKPFVRGFGHYVLGVLMVIQRASGGNTSYFLGEISNAGWWYYFPVLFLTKEAIASLTVLFLGLGLWLGKLWQQTRQRIRGKEPHTPVWQALLKFVSENTAELALASFIILYWVYSIRSPLNIGVRHILPTIPLMYILAWKAMQSWVGNFSLTTLRKVAFKLSIIGLLTLTLVISTITTAPLFLSSFNIFGGGDKYGYRIAVDSNYDWGQDLKRLAQWVDARNNDIDPSNDIRKIAVDYFGAGSPRYYLGDLFEPWSTSKRNPSDYGIEFLAVSATFLEGSIAQAKTGETKGAQNQYDWIENPDEPYARAGTSIFIYRFSPTR